MNAALSTKRTTAKKTTPAKSTPKHGNLVLIDLSVITPSATNSRQIFNPQKMDELVASVSAKGIIQPIIVRSVEKEFAIEPGKRNGKPGFFLIDCRAPGYLHSTVKIPLAEMSHAVGQRQVAFFETEQAALDALPRFEIVAGERRYRAAQTVGLKQIPAIIRELSDAEAFDLQLIENLQRVDLDSLEEARGFRAAIDKLGYTIDSLAEKVSKSRNYIYAMLKLCDLPENAIAALQDGTISKSHAELIARLPNEKMRNAFAAEVLVPEWDKAIMSLRKAKALQEQKYMRELKGAVFSREDPELVPAAGSCISCPKMTGNSRELFPDGRGDMCTDTQCFTAKNRAHQKQVEAAGVASGLQMVKSSKSLFSSWDNHLQSKDYVELGSSPVEDKKKRTFRELLADSEVKILGAVDKKGRLRKLVPRAEAEEALKAKGITLKSPSNGRFDQSAWNEEQRKKKEQQAIKEAAASKAVARITSFLWKLNSKTLAILVESINGFDAVKTPTSKCKTTEDFLRLAMQAIVSDGLRVWAGNWYDGNRSAARAKRILSLAKVDLKSLVKQATTELSEKHQKPKQKARSK
jgi:ParB/RepB/Spo0J family partition protein